MIAICGGLLSIMDGCGAMLKSLYSFKATYSAALTFREGDIFLELDTSKSDRWDESQKILKFYKSEDKQFILECQLLFREARCWQG